MLACVKTWLEEFKHDKSLSLTSLLPLLMCWIRVRGVRRFLLPATGFDFILWAAFLIFPSGCLIHPLYQRHTWKSPNESLTGSFEKRGKLRNLIKERSANFRTFPQRCHKLQKDVTGCLQVRGGTQKQWFGFSQIFLINHDYGGIKAHRWQQSSSTTQNK